MRNVKVTATSILRTPVVGKFRDILPGFTTNLPSEGSGISRWAVKKLAGMEWPHRILFEPDLRNQGKNGLLCNHK